MINESAINKHFKAEIPKDGVARMASGIKKNKKELITVRCRDDR